MQETNLLLHGDVRINDGKVSLSVSVYSKDAREEYGLLIVKDGELVKSFGKKAKEAWPVVKQAFGL